MKKSFSFKNLNKDEINDVRNPDVFQLEGYRYEISVRPKCEFWRVGLRFWLENRSPGYSTTHRYNNNQIRHIELCAGTRTKNGWESPNLLQLQQYNITDSEFTLFSLGNYTQGSEIKMVLQSKDFGKLELQLLYKDIAHTVEVNLGFHKTFQVWAWADYSDFEVDTDVNLRFVPITFQLENTKALTNQKRAIIIEKLGVFFGGNNSGKTSVLIAACNAYHNKMYASLDYLGLNRLFTESTYNFELESLPDYEKVSRQEDNRRRRIKSKSGQNELFDWMEELALQDEATRSQILDWISLHFESWEFEEQKTGKYVRGVEAKVNKRDPLDQGSGARAALPIIIQLYNPLIELLAIDEPELGLEPRMQKVLFRAIKDASEGLNGFPLKRILLATHSHLFLDRSEVKNNFSVQKASGLVDIKQLDTTEELHNANYQLLGGNPSDLFFPSNVIIVEGPSDRIFLNAIFQLGKNEGLFKSENLAFHFLDGYDKLKEGAEAIAQMLKTQSYVPVYRDRICGLFDRPHRKGKLIQEVRNLFNDGKKERFIELEKPAIEYYYPLAAVNRAFKASLSSEEYEQMVREYLDGIRRNSPYTGTFLNETVSKVTFAKKIIQHLDSNDLTKVDSNILSLLKTADDLAFD